MCSPAEADQGEIHQTTHSLTAHSPTQHPPGHPLTRSLAHLGQCMASSCLKGFMLTGKGREGKGRGGEGREGEGRIPEPNNMKHSRMTMTVRNVRACGMLAGACMPGALPGRGTEGGHRAGSTRCPAI